jgi:hypothetical protein
LNADGEENYRFKDKRRGLKYGDKMYGAIAPPTRHLPKKTVNKLQIEPKLGRPTTTTMNSYKIGFGNKL